MNNYKRTQAYNAKVMDEMLRLSDAEYLRIGMNHSFGTDTPIDPELKYQPKVFVNPKSLGGIMKSDTYKILGDDLTIV